MKAIDPFRERSERKLSLPTFLKFYNENLPLGFPRASVDILKEFKKIYPTLFKGHNPWSLEQHRKKFMDWRSQHPESFS